MSSSQQRATETAALVAILRWPSRHTMHYAELIEETGSARTVLEDEQGLLAGQLLEEAAHEIADWTQQGIRLITVLDPDYPENLRAIHDRPPLIFLTGELQSSDSQAVAVIGSRNATDAGIERAQHYTERLVAEDYTIVSGLAAGIDATAHLTAFERGGRTVAVIGTGLNHSYPAENADLQRRIAAEGAVISQFWPDTPPSRETFPARNAVMSGLALATLIVEASHRSGARTQARHALGHGRPVFLARELLDQPWARDLAGRPGTLVVDSPEKLIDTLESLCSTDSLVP